MKIAIVGFAGQGQSAYEYWNKKGNTIVICDQSANTEIPKGTTARLGRDYLRNLDEFDLIIRSPAVHQSLIVAENSPEILKKVTSNTNEFLKVCPTKNVIGVTGTKGKGTTSTLITKMLEKAGMRVHLGGNIGIPPLELLKDDIKKEDWVVLELANFQLIDLKYSPHIAVVLMVEPEHLDWHEDVDEYIAAKQQLFMNQNKDDIAIYCAKNKNSLSVADATSGQLIPYMQKPGAIVEKEVIKIDGNELCKTTELKLLGEHNWQNVCAAVTAVWQVTQDTKAIAGVLKSFGGLPFRIEPRGEVKGIKYYNDSFASAPDASMAAMQAIPEHKVMIIGGHERNLGLGPFVSFIAKAKDIRKIVVIGQSGDRIIQEFMRINFDNYVHCNSKDMMEIVRIATSLARKGDAVVLSPGFASFDMFKNFEDRGLQFNAAIKKL